MIFYLENHRVSIISSESSATPCGSLQTTHSPQPNAATDLLKHKRRLGPLAGALASSRPISDFQIALV